jgi:hypothetical protein
MLWLAAIFGVVAAAFFLHGAWTLWNGKRSLRWPSARGVITSSRIEERIQSPSSSGPEESVYDALVRYEFTVGGRKLTGRRISFMPLGASLADVKEIARRYKVGKSVNVYYHPTNPKLCTLEQGTTKFAWVVVCVAGLVLIFLLGIPAGYVGFTPVEQAKP